MTPRVLFRRVAIAEAITWALLLVGMFLKYVTETTELGVRVFGMVHGVVFVAYCLVTLVVWVDQRWTPGRGMLGLMAAVPPFATIAFDVYAERHGMLSTDWRLVSRSPASLPERAVSWLLRNPAHGALAGLAAVVVLTGAALLVGPPA
ncbi:MAG: DUF3817 domain-containing protein [Nocardioides sp.]|nr:DUF3817 domain-containing protein [Nocardioides sp.]